MCVSWIWCLIFTRCVRRGPEGEGGGQDGVVGMEVEMGVEMGVGVGILKANVGGGVGLRDSG